MNRQRSQDDWRLSDIFSHSTGGVYLAALAVIMLLAVVLVLDNAAKRGRQATPPPMAGSAEISPKEREDLYRQLAELGRAIALAGEDRERLVHRIDQLLALRGELQSDADRHGTLTSRLAEIEQELAAVARALEATERGLLKRQVEVAGLGTRLNRALLAKTEELRRSRSDFLARLRDVLGDRGEFRMEGDRFTLPAEILFAPGSDQLSPKGSEEVRRLAATINAVRGEFPPDLNWVLRVGGHTDSKPISSARFPSNWELSALRAVTVVKALAAADVPPERLVAAGFGEHQPLPGDGNGHDGGRSRRIEFRLDTP